MYVIKEAIFDNRCYIMSFYILFINYLNIYIYIHFYTMNLLFRSEISKNDYTRNIEKYINNFQK